MKAKLLKTASGALVPMDDDNAMVLMKIKAGSVVNCDVSEMRNGPYFRKWWSLAKMAFDLASERMKPREYKGKPVMPSFDSFRKDLIILAGYYDVTYKYDGSIRLEAQSLQWSKMNEETFDALYSATIDAVLQKILPDLNQEDLESAVNATLSYT